MFKNLITVIVISFSIAWSNLHHHGNFRPGHPCF